MNNSTCDACVSVHLTSCATTSEAILDSRWDDELANIRHKRIMDCFETESTQRTQADRRSVSIVRGRSRILASASDSDAGALDEGTSSEYTGLQLKKMAGFGKEGYKNFDGMMTELQMQTYLVVKDFRCKRNKHGLEYGMPVCVYSKPEDLWGYDMVTAAYSGKPEDSREKIFAHVRELYPDATEKQLAAVLK